MPIDLPTLRPYDVPALQPPGPIGLVAPASAPRDRTRLDMGIRSLEQRGFRVERLLPTPAGRGYLAASDVTRAAEFNSMILRPDVRHLFCVRGGFGSMRILDHINYDEAARLPKLLVGYSDITALQLALFARSGWRSLSGPMVAVDWPEPDPATENLFWNLARGGCASPVLNPDGSGLVGVCPGDHTGTLLGGNLSMVVRLLGTGFLPDLEGAILFLEDVGEAPYRLDAYFAQLRLSGVLESLGGLVLGGFTEAEPPQGSPTLTLESVLSDYFSDAPYPVARGLQYGHFAPKVTMPIGVKANLAVAGNRAVLSVLEPVTLGGTESVFTPS